MKCSPRDQLELEVTSRQHLRVYADVQCCAVLPDENQHLNSQHNQHPQQCTCAGHSLQDGQMRKTESQHRITPKITF